jgi:hypothetical protein
MFPPMINWRVHEFDSLYPLWARLCNQGTSFNIHISWGRTWRVFHEAFLGNKHYKTNVELSNTFTIVPLKIQNYNYSIIFFLRPKRRLKVDPMQDVFDDWLVSMKVIIYWQLITRRQTTYYMHNNKFECLSFLKKLFVIGVLLKGTIHTK